LLIVEGTGTTVGIIGRTSDGSGAAGRWHTRKAIRLVVAVWVLVLWVPSASATAKAPPKPVLLTLKWRLVMRAPQHGLGAVGASDRYVAIVHGVYGGAAHLMLIDDQTGRRKNLSPPVCPNINSPTFGGPWLLVTCSPGFNSTPPTYELYNLHTGRWTPFRVSSQCQGSCQAVAVGRYWVKILTDEGIPTYGPSDYYLQNISTGLFERDPAAPGGTIFDDLDAPSGSVPLCRPLRYPSVGDPHGGPIRYLGALRFYGQFALTAPYYTDYQGTSAYRLRRCGSKLNQFIWNGYETHPPISPQPVASSRAAITTEDGVTLHGWYLPTLRRFTIRPTLNAHAQPVGLTKRKIYVSTATQDHNWLWAATLPAAHRP
jgi:hypothetical protein